MKRNRVGYVSFDQYVDAANQTLRESLESPPEFMSLVQETEDLFRYCFSEICPEFSEASALLAQTGVLTWHAAVRQALSGQPVTVMPLARTALECCAYLYLMQKDPEAFEAWMQRGESEKSLKKCKNKLNVTKACARLEQESPELSSYILKQYEGLIDHGAHPNKKSVFNYLTTAEQRGDGSRTIVLGGVFDKPVYINFGLGACVEIAIVMVCFLVFAVPEEKRPDDIGDRIQQLRRNINQLVGSPALPEIPE